MWASHGLDRFCVRPYSVIGPELQVSCNPNLVPRAMPVRGLGWHWPIGNAIPARAQALLWVRDCCNPCCNLVPRVLSPLINQNKHYIYIKIYFPFWTYYLHKILIVRINEVKKLINNYSQKNQENHCDFACDKKNHVTLRSSSRRHSIWS